MSNQFTLCDSCVQRHCKLKPVSIKGSVGQGWMCGKYRKHQTGFKMEEVYYEKRRQ